MPVTVCALLTLPTEGQLCPRHCVLGLAERGSELSQQDWPPAGEV